MAAKTTPFFTVEPDAILTFNYIPRKYLNANIRLTNISDHPLAFKVKTDVPTCYLVKPHVGTLPPHHSTNINITMQPTDYNPQTASISDKFLINVIPLPLDTDLAALADQTRFQQTWDAFPKSQVQNHKLKVILKFENVTRSNTTPDRPEKTPEEANKQSGMSDSQKAQASAAPSYNTSKSYDTGRESQESRDDFKNNSMMMSFGNPVNQTLNAQSRGSNVSQGSWAGTSGEQGLATSQTIVLNRGVNEEREKEQPRMENRETLRPLEEKVEQLGKRIEELMEEKKVLNQRHQELTGKAEEQKRMLFELSEENTKLKSELGNLKSSTFLEKPQKKGQENGTYQLWQLLVVSFVAMVIGAYMSSS